MYIEVFNLSVVLAKMFRNSFGGGGLSEINLYQNTTDIHQWISILKLSELSLCNLQNDI